MKLAAVKIHSKILNASVWLAMSREGARHIWRQGVREAIFLPEEIEAMKAIPAAMLPPIHRAKLANPGARVEGWDVPPKEAPVLPQEQQLDLGVTTLTPKGVSFSGYAYGNPLR